MTFIESKELYLKYPNANQSSLKHKIATALRINQKTSHHNNIYQLNNVNFNLLSGQRMAVLGSNGSGKTTLLNVLSGIYEPNYGSITISGKRSSFIQISAGMNHNMTGEQNTRLNGMYRGIGQGGLDSFVKKVYEFCDLGEKFYQPIKTYSSGMQVRLAFAMSTSSDAEVLIMDEWLSAGDKNFIEKATTRMNKLAMNAKILILATHSIDLARQWCNCALVMSNGHATFYPDAEDGISAYEILND